MYDIIRATPAPRRAMDRQRSRELAEVERRGDLAEATVAALNRVGQRAIGELTLTGLIRKEAERICPDETEIYSMVSAAVGVGSVQAINNITRR